MVKSQPANAVDLAAKHERIAFSVGLCGMDKEASEAILIARALRLMAAQPDLLAAIDEARKFIEDEYRDPAAELVGEWLAPEARPLHRMLCAALSKATTP